MKLFIVRLIFGIKFLRVRIVGIYINMFMCVVFLFFCFLGKIINFFILNGGCLIGVLNERF